MVTYSASSRGGNNASNLSSRSSNGSFNSQNSTSLQLGSTSIATSSGKKEPSISGYTADIERLVKKINTPFPATIDFLSRKNKCSSDNDGYGTTTAAGEHDQASKRFKLLELNYQAAMVKSDLAKAGLRVPMIRKSCPRTLPSISGVDMSSVTLMHSKDYDAALMDKRNDYDKLFQSDEVRTKWVVDLAMACRHAYAFPDVAESKMREKMAYNAEANVENDTASSTSSVTDPDSEDNNNALSSTPLISMGEALSLHSQPRLVTLASAPFTIVHMNGAFSRLTGLSSANVLGQSFFDVMSNGNSKQAKQLQSKTEPESLKTLHNQVIEYASIASNQAGASNNGHLATRVKKSKVSVASVGVNVENVTHFVLNFNDRNGNPFIFNESPATAQSRGVAIKSIG